MRKNSLICIYDKFIHKCQKYTIADINYERFGQNFPNNRIPSRLLLKHKISCSNSGFWTLYQKEREKTKNNFEQDFDRKFQSKTKI